MGESVVEVLRTQCGVLFENIRVTVEACTDELLAKPSPQWPIWKQLYHMLHSVDEWFIDPLSFTEPAIHRPHFRTSEPGPGQLSKQQ